MVGLLCTCSSSTEAASIKPTSHLATVFSLLQWFATINPGYLCRLHHVASSDGLYDFPMRIYQKGLLRSMCFNGLCEMKSCSAKKLLFVPKLNCVDHVYA